jgi:hypothetical protein
VQEELREACSDAGITALVRFITYNRAKHVINSNIPYRLFRIENIPEVGWAATDFISVRVARFVYGWVSDHLNHQRMDFIQLIRNPFSHGLFGTIFENWVSSGLSSKGKMLVLPRVTPRRLVFHGLQYFSWKQLRTKVAISPVLLETGILYKPEGSKCPSIDGYALHGDVLLLLQSTVARSHSKAVYSVVVDIIVAARAKIAHVRILMVYIVPQAVKAHFRAPVCSSLLEEDVSVVVGVVNDETDLVFDLENEFGGAAAAFEVPALEGQPHRKRARRSHHNDGC